jgi:hypothetical protein
MSIVSGQVMSDSSSGGKLGNHHRWHVARGVVNPDCPLCGEGGGSPGDGIGGALVLAEKELHLLHAQLRAAQGRYDEMRQICDGLRLAIKRYGSED